MQTAVIDDVHGNNGRASSVSERHDSCEVGLRGRLDMVARLG